MIGTSIGSIIILKNLKQNNIINNVHNHRINKIIKLNDNTIITVSDDRRCIVHNFDIKKLNNLIKKNSLAHDSKIKSLTLYKNNEDTNNVITGTTTGFIRLWNINEENDFKRKKSKYYGVNDIIVTNDDKYIIVGYDIKYGIIEIFNHNLESLSIIGNNFNGHHNSINSLLHCNKYYNKNVLLSSSNDGTIKVFDLDKAIKEPEIDSEIISSYSHYFGQFDGILTSGVILSNICLYTCNETPNMCSIIVGFKSGGLTILDLKY